MHAGDRAGICCMLWGRCARIDLVDPTRLQGFRGRRDGASGSCCLELSSRDAVSRTCIQHASFSQTRHFLSRSHTYSPLPLTAGMIHITPKQKQLFFYGRFEGGIRFGIQTPDPIGYIGVDRRNECLCRGHITQHTPQLPHKTSDFRVRHATLRCHAHRRPTGRTQ